MNKETPGERRERLRQEELERNPTGSIQGGGLQDLIGDLGWKGAGILNPHNNSLYNNLFSYLPLNGGSSFIRDVSFSKK